MSGVELIVAALSAGAAAGLTDTASVAVQDAYTKLKDAVRPWLRGEARQALDADEIDPGVWEAQVGEELGHSGASRDDEVLALAARLLSLADQRSAEKYRVNAPQAKGVQTGDYNVQNNNF